MGTVEKVVSKLTLTTEQNFLKLNLEILDNMLRAGKEKLQND